MAARHTSGSAEGSRSSGTRAEPPPAPTSQLALSPDVALIPPNTLLSHPATGHRAGMVPGTLACPSGLMWHVTSPEHAVSAMPHHGAGQCHPNPCSITMFAPSSSLHHPHPCTILIPGPFPFLLYPQPCYMLIPVPSPALLHPQPCCIAILAPSSSLLHHCSCIILIPTPSLSLLHHHPCSIPIPVPS